MILHHIGRIGRSGVDDLIDATFGEAAGADHIRNMDPLHPVEPLQLDASLNGYLNFVNDHNVACTMVSVLVLIGLALHPCPFHD